MKKIIKMFNVLSIFLCCLFIFGCSNENSSSKPNVSNETVTLNKTEQSIFDVLSNSLVTFNNPKSVKFISYVSHYWNSEMMTIRLSAENKLGGTVNHIYVMMLENVQITLDKWKELNPAPYHFVAGSDGYILKKGLLYSITELGDPHDNSYYEKTGDLAYVIMWNIYEAAPCSSNKIDSISSSKINQALEKYKISMGW